MTEEEKEAIDRLNRIITTKFNNDYSIDNLDKEAIETVLSMLKQKDKEIEKKDKIIDLMAEEIKERKYVFTNKTKKEIKQYYERKSENGN